MQRSQAALLLHDGASVQCPAKIWACRALADRARHYRSSARVAENLINGLWRLAMRRVVSLFLPYLPTERLRRKRGKPQPEDVPPLATALTVNSRRMIVSPDAPALALGVLPGMTVTKARGLVPDLEVVDADPEADREALRKLALWAGRRYSPQVAPDPPAGIWLDITGCEGLFGGEEPLAKDLYRRIRASGLTPHIGIADTAGCAHAVARQVRSGRPVHIPPGRTAEALGLLPVSALRIESGVAADLARMGFTRIEELMAAPRAPLGKRFSRELFRRLDQALGTRPEPIEPIFAEEMPYAVRHLLEPIGTPEAFAQVIDDLVHDVVSQLLRKGGGVRRLDLMFKRVDGHTQAIRIGTAAATRDEPHLTKLFNARIGEVEPGLGIEAMRLACPLSEPLGPSQIDHLASNRHQGPDLSALVDALANRFGRRSLYRTRPQASAMPEREVRLIAPLAPESGAVWNEDLPRPSRLLEPPERVDVTALLPDHPPRLFVWRGKPHRITRADGPERLYGEWWREQGTEADTPYLVRDYFQVETESGGRYWLFRIGDGERPATGPMQWFIHGAFA